MQRVLKIYKTSEGKEPLVKWLNSINDSRTKKRIINHIDKLKLNIGDVKSVGGGVFELRMFFGSGYRVYYTNLDDIILLLLCAGDKSSQEKDIKKAKEYWDNYKKENFVWVNLVTGMNILIES